MSVVVIISRCINIISYHCFTGMRSWTDYKPSEDGYLESFEQAFQGRTASFNSHHEQQQAVTLVPSFLHQLVNKGDYKSNYQPGKRFRCEKCGNTYRWKESLRNHEKLECGKEPQFQCLYCPYRSKLNWNLQKHISRKHPQENLQICQL